MDAHCRKFKDIRMYRLNRIRKAEILPQTGYEIREDYSFKKRHQHAFSIFTGGSPQTVRIRFNQRKALFIEEVLWHPSQKITPDPDHPGSIIFEVTVSYPKEVIWWMRHWGSDAEVLEPQEMREYEAGKAYGYSHPGKVHGWTKSAAWNHGLKAGQAEYNRQAREEEKKARAYWKHRREHGFHSESDDKWD